MIGAKDYSAVDVVLSFIAALVDQATEYSDDSNLTTVYTIYSGLNHNFMFKLCDAIGSSVSC